jgi:hypothetical protein
LKVESRRGRATTSTFSFQLSTLLLVALATGCTTTWRSPEEAVRERLARAAHEGVSMEVAGVGTLRFERLELAEMVVRVSESGRRATVLCRAEGRGSLGGSAVSYVGGETLALKVGRSGWQPEGVWLPSLAGVLEALPNPAVAPRRDWAIRVERGHAIASESSLGDASERVRRFELERRPEGWRIASGLL